LKILRLCKNLRLPKLSTILSFGQKTRWIQQFRKNILHRRTEMALTSYMRMFSADRIPLPMKNSLRLLVLSGMLALMVSPAFADTSSIGPGGPNPPYPPGGGTSTTTTNTTVNGTNTTGSTTTIWGEILGILGAIGF
jgi:hypothetical protein